VRAMKLKLNCGCLYNSSSKQYEKYCPRHFRIVATNAIVRQNALRQAQLREERIQQRQLQQKKKKRYYIKPLF
jgi:hypothetical protein